LQTELKARDYVNLVDKSVGKDRLGGIKMHFSLNKHFYLLMSFPDAILLPFEII